MDGTTISALTTVPLVRAGGTATPFAVTAAVLAVYAPVAALVMRNTQGRALPSGSLDSRLADTARLPLTWHASLLYAVVFGGYVAFSVYLPAYLKTAYGLAQSDAANRHGRVRAARGGDAPAGRLAVRPARAGAGARGGARRGGRGRGGVPGHGRGPRCGQRRGVRAGGAAGPGEPGRVGHRRGRSDGWPRRFRAVAADGRAVRGDVVLRAGPGRAGGRGARDDGVHADRRAAQHQWTADAGRPTRRVVGGAARVSDPPGSAPTAPPSAGGSASGPGRSRTASW